MTGTDPVIGPVADVEEARLADVAERFPELLTVHADHVQALRDEFSSAHSASARLQSVGAHSHRLWLDAIANQSERFDDRPLYWSRLAMRETVRELAPVDELAALLARLEAVSRGLLTLAARVTDRRVVVVTGFDPFFLDEHLDQSNPSGLAALNLHGRVIDTPAGEFEVRSYLVPVRFQDFDDGLVEQIVAAAVDADAELILTVSMGRDGFDLERFPGARRSAQAPDNRNVLTGASADAPMRVTLAGEVLDGPEFVEFSLPVDAMLGCASGPFDVLDNRTVQTVERGEFDADSLAELEDQVAVAGSGGGYLSNEISYRVLRALQRQGSDVPSGHLHTPRLTGYDEDRERQIVDQIEQLLTCNLGAIEDR